MSEDKVKPVHGMFAVPAPPAFDFDQTSEWPSWIQLFDDYRFASGLNERSEEAQVRTLLYAMGRQAREIFSTFTLSEQQQKHALAKARLKETVQRQQQQLRETSDEPSAAPASNLDAVNKQRQPRKNSSGQRTGTSSRTSAPVTQGQRTRPQSYRPLTSSSCPNCGQGEHPRTSCPA
ncbi:hypothetical protein MRX96_041988 [Rhipicephalus microplus]